MFGEGVAGEGEGRGLPGPRPLPKKRPVGAGVEAVSSNLSKFLEQTASTDVLDKSCGVRKQVVSGEVGAFPHIPTEAQTTSFDPDVRNAFEGSSVLRRRLLSTRSGWSTRSGRVVLDGGVGGEVGEEPCSVLGALQELLQKRPVVPLHLAVLPSTKSHVGNF